MATVEHRVEAESARVTVERLYREHVQRVNAVCGAVLRDRAEAEDATQQVFVSAFCALLRGSEPRDHAAWLVTIARNESWGRARRRTSLAVVPEVADVAQEDPSVSAQRHGDLARIWQAIAALPEAQRQALLLRELQGLSYEELAADLQLSVASVRSLLNRARRTLRNQLQKGAALVGAQWLNLLARLFGDASTQTVSSASRTAAVGLGALALTGTVAVAPSLVATKHHRQLPPRVVPTHPLTPRPAEASTAVTPSDAATVAVITTGGTDHHGRDRTSDSGVVVRLSRSSGGSDSGESTVSSGDGGPGPSSSSGSESGDSGSDGGPGSGSSDGSGGHDGSG